MSLTSPLVYYWENIEGKKKSKKGEKPHYLVSNYIIEKMERKFEECGKPKEMIYTIKPKELVKEIKKSIPECSDITTREVGCIIPTILQKSGLREREDYYDSLSGGNRYWHVILSINNIKLLMSLK